MNDMTTLKKQFADLVSLTGEHIRKEYSPSGTIRISPENREFLNRKSKPSPETAPVASPQPHPVSDGIAKVRMDPGSDSPSPVRDRVQASKSSHEIPEASTAESCDPNPSLVSVSEEIVAAPPTETASRPAEPFFKRDPVPPPSSPDRLFAEWSPLIVRLFPGISLHEHPPVISTEGIHANDVERVEKAAPILILSFSSNEKSSSFIGNIARAVSLMLAPVLVLSVKQSRNWPCILHSSEVRLIIAEEEAIFTQPALQSVYKNSPEEGKHFLDRIPLLLLPKLSVYFEQPSVKSLLWRTIRNEFSTLRPASP